MHGGRQSACKLAPECGLFVAGRVDQENLLLKNRAGDTLNRWLSFSMCCLFSSLLPYKTSETMLSDPSSGARSFCLRLFAAINSANTSTGETARMGSVPLRKPQSEPSAVRRTFLRTPTSGLGAPGCRAVPWGVHSAPPM